MRRILYSKWSKLAISKWVSEPLSGDDPMRFLRRVRLAEKNGYSPGKRGKNLLLRGVDGGMHGVARGEYSGLG